MRIGLVGAEVLEAIAQLIVEEVTAVAGSSAIVADEKCAVIALVSGIFGVHLGDGPCNETAGEHVLGSILNGNAGVHGAGSDHGELVLLGPSCTGGSLAIGLGSQDSDAAFVDQFGSLLGNVGGVGSGITVDQFELLAVQAASLVLFFQGQDSTSLSPSNGSGCSGRAVGQDADLDGIAAGSGAVSSGLGSRGCRSRGAGGAGCIGRCAACEAGRQSGCQGQGNNFFHFVFLLFDASFFINRYAVRAPYSFRTACRDCGHPLRGRSSQHCAGQWSPAAHARRRSLLRPSCRPSGRTCSSW